jgi:hypothetical protein
MGKEPTRVLTPEDDEWEVPSPDGTPKGSGGQGGGSGTPISTQPYKPELVPLDIPPYVKPDDHTAPIGGYGPGTTNRRRDLLTRLTVEKEVELLAMNNIYLSTNQLGRTGDGTLGAMAAYVVEGSLEPARKLAVRFKKVSLRPPLGGDRQDTLTYSYNHLNRTCKGSSSAAPKLDSVFP